MLKEYLKSKSKLKEDEVFSGQEGLHMATNNTKLYMIHSDYFCKIRPSWHKDINEIE